MARPSTVDERIAAMGPIAFAELAQRTAPAARAELLRRRFRAHPNELCKFCFPDRFELPFSALHRSMFRLARLPTWRERAEDVRVAIAAPRSFAKSTILSFAEPAHDIVYDREAFLVLMSATQPQSRRFSKLLRAAFVRDDTRLAKLYGPFEVHGGVDEWEVSVRGRPPVAVVSQSFGGEVRGLLHPTLGIRPTKVVIDDGEKKDRVRNPDQRAVWEETLQKDILKLGRRQGGLLTVMGGTTLHQDSILSRRLVDPGWVSERWKALLAWPKRADLWERCRAIWTDLTLGKNRRAAALAFYKANKRAMDEGAVLLDPAAKDLFQLYEIIWAEGMGSFLSELQNEPTDPATQIFWSPRFKRFRVVGDELEVLDDTHRRVKLRSLRKIGWWDPATGSPHGDYAAIAVIGRDEHGYSYVLACWMRRASPSEQLAAAWALAEKYALTRMLVEDVGFQALVAEPYQRQRVERREKGEYWQLQILGKGVQGDKDFRIATLEPDVTNQWLMFADTIPPEVLQQFDAFPSGDHDDGPDAIQSAWQASGGRPAHMETREAA